MDNTHQQTMDRVYRHMKHVYDATRPLFLAGRQTLRNHVAETSASRVLEVGCGTARNPILLARQMPDTHFVGLDISREMCSYARQQVDRNGLADRIKIFEGELADYLGAAGSADDPPARAPGSGFDAVIFSYSLSMIPNWWETLEQSLDALPDGGRLMIADFGGCQSWPALARWRLYKNLSHFHVFPRPDLAARLSARLAARDGLGVKERQLFGGYAVVLDATVPAARATSHHPAPPLSGANATTTSTAQGDSAS